MPAGARPPSIVSPSQRERERDVAVSDEHERRGRLEQREARDLLAEHVVPDRIARAAVEELGSGPRRRRLQRGQPAARVGASTPCVQRTAAAASPLKSEMSSVPITARSWLPQSATVERSRARATHSFGRGP